LKKKCGDLLTQILFEKKEEEEEVEEERGEKKGREGVKKFDQTKKEQEESNFQEELDVIGDTSRRKNC
jgi:hypothetical protein